MEGHCNLCFPFGRCFLPPSLFPSAPSLFLVKINRSCFATYYYFQEGKPRKIKPLSSFGCLLFNVQNTGVVIALKCI